MEFPEFKINPVVHPVVARYLDTIDPRIVGYEKGDRIEKTIGGTAEGDFVEIGALGTVVGSYIIPAHPLTDFREVPTLFIEWDDIPDTYVAISPLRVRKFESWFV